MSIGAKHELGWADFQTRDSRAIIRHWHLVMLAFTFSPLTEAPPAGTQIRADALVADLGQDAWGTLSCGAGSQGERVYDWACIHLPYETASGMAQWLLVRRKRSDATELAYFRAYGPEAATLDDLVRVAGIRWAIEESFEDAKGSVGLDQYEVRKWTPWYRHVTLALLAHAYLEVTRRQVNKEEKGGQQTWSR